MQLKNIGKSHPIILTASLMFAGTAFSYSYGELKHSNIPGVVQNVDTSNYLNDIESNSYDYLILKMEFQERLKRWENKVLFLSSVNSIVKDEDFLAIIGMGEKIVPLILNEIKEKPSLLVWSLNFIYQKKITNNSQITVENACKLWLKEFKA